MHFVVIVLYKCQFVFSHVAIENVECELRKTIKVTDINCTCSIKNYSPLLIVNIIGPNRDGLDECNFVLSVCEVKN